MRSGYDGTLPFEPGSFGGRAFLRQGPLVPFWRTLCPDWMGACEGRATGAPLATLPSQRGFPGGFLEAGDDGDVGDEEGALHEHAVGGE